MFATPRSAGGLLVAGRSALNHGESHGHMLGAWRGLLPGADSVRTCGHPRIMQRFAHKPRPI
jgi:hypothetical protein